MGGAPLPSSGPTSTAEKRSRVRSRSRLPTLLGAPARPPPLREAALGVRASMLGEPPPDSAAPDAERPLTAQRSARLRGPG